MYTYVTKINLYKLIQCIYKYIYIYIKKYNLATTIVTLF